MNQQAVAPNPYAGRAEAFAKQVAGMNSQDLLQDGRSAYQAIYVARCFGTRDIFYLDAIVNELKARGYGVDERKTDIVFTPPAAH